jgi:formamidopyrimidine-DNA glycosylase
LDGASWRVQIMPELPEVETIARGVHTEVAGRRIIDVAITRPDVLREVTARALPGRVRGTVIDGARRRAKHIVIDLASGDHLVVQPRFTGALLVGTPATLPAEELAYSTLAFLLDDGRSLHYRDIRRLGTVSLMNDERFEAYFATLGVEPLAEGFTADVLSGILRGSSQAVKKVIMDQYKVVGVGNIYANEALWRTGIDPSRAARNVTPAEAAELRDAIVNVLTEAIAQRGSSFRDYRDTSGDEGKFVDFLAAYGRAGKPCLRCGATLIGTHAIDGRQSVLCARCQH